MKVWLCMLLFPLYLCGEILWQSESASPVKVSIKLSAQHLTLEDLLEIEMDFDYPAAYRLNVEQLIDQLTWNANPLWPQWNVLHAQSTPLQTSQDREAQRLNITLAPLREGSVQLALLGISFRPKKGDLAPVSISTPIFALEIAPSPASTKPLEIAPLMPLENQFPLKMTAANRALWIDNPEEQAQARQELEDLVVARTFPWSILVSLLGLAGLGWIIYLARTGWSMKLAARQNPPMTFQALLAETLEQLQKLAPTATPQSYAQLSGLLRKVLGHSLESENAATLTTEELAKELKNRPGALSPEQIEQGLELLREMDRVKFAEEELRPQEMGEHFQAVAKFLESLHGSLR
jgi:hypothetical protein